VTTATRTTGGMKMYEEGTLRPPTPKEMAARYVPLEQIHLDWMPACWEETFCPHETHDGLPLVVGMVRTWHTLDFSTLELIEFHKQHVIPYEARLVGYGYDGELALDWTHVEL
jgi:hypothetical protein